MKNSEERARFFMSDARKEWHDPQIVLGAIGIMKGMTLADLGSGPGFFTIPMAQMTGENGIVYAVDRDPTMLKYLQENIAKAGLNEKIIKIVNSDVASTGLSKNSIDIVFFANVLHEVSDKTAFFQEVKRICKPSAKVVDLDWKKIKTDHGPPLQERLTEREAAKLFSENGFTIIKEMNAGLSHYELICKLIKIDS